MKENLKKLTDLGITEENAKLLIEGMLTTYSHKTLQAQINEYCEFVRAVSKLNAEDSAQNF